MPIELSLLMMRSFIFVKKCSNNTFMQFSNACLRNSNRSGNLSEVNFNNFMNMIAHSTSYHLKACSCSRELLRLCEWLNSNKLSLNVSKSNSLFFILINVNYTVK